MAKLIWGDLEDRRYSAGVDRGVIYIPGKPAVPWNGLKSISHEKSVDVTANYFEGVRSNLTFVPSGFSARITSYTFPDDLVMSAGYSDIGNGVMTYTNNYSRFHLTYRTMNNNSAGSDDYTIHIIYNAFVTLPEIEYETINEDPETTMFEWDVESIPDSYSGGFSSYIFVNTQTASRNKVKILEDILYGTDGGPDANIPDIDFVVNTLQ